MNNKIAIIGGGNLGSAIATGLVNTKTVNASNVFITRRRPELLSSLANMGVNTGSDNKVAVKGADIVFLAVKPYQISEVLKEVVSVLSEKAIIISLATGIQNNVLFTLSGEKNAVYRVMPNTAIAIGESMTCIAGYNTSKEQDAVVQELFEKLGDVLFISEELMGAATVLASCGIAYALRYIRAATEAGVEAGFSADMALKITAQTVKGAAALIDGGKSHPEIEIDKVTTPKGITITGLNAMEHNGFSSSVINGVMSAFKKIEGK